MDGKLPNLPPDASREALVTVAGLQHDLSALYNHIYGGLEEIKRLCIGNAQATEAVSAQGARLRHLDQLMTCVMDIIRHELGGLSKNESTFKLELVTEELERELKEIARFYGAHLHIAHEAVTVSTDKTRLTRIMRNLLWNAIRHSQGENIYMSCEWTATTLSMIVEDDGQGLDDAILPSVFEMNKPGKDNQRPIEERVDGIGLFTSRLNAELIGGKMLASRSEHGGARFELRLENTVVTACDSLLPIKDLGESHLKGKVIIVLDDDEQVGQTTQYAFEAAGAVVCRAKRPLEVIFERQTLQRQPDLYVLDFMLQDRTALDLIDTLTQFGDAQERMVVVTSWTQNDRLALLPKAIRVYEKPLQARAYQEMAERCLASAQE